MKYQEQQNAGFGQAYGGTNARSIFSGLITLIVIVLAVSCFFGLVGYNGSAEFTIYKPRLYKGDAQVISANGPYLKLFANCTKYPKFIDDEYTQGCTDKSPVDESCKATFNDGGTAKVDTFVSIKLPTEDQHRLHLDERFNGDLDGISTAVHAHMANCIKAGAPVMSASENQASRKAEFNGIVEGMLKLGLYEMVRTNIQLDDLVTLEETVNAKGEKIAVEKKATVGATKIVEDAAGQPKVETPSPLLEFGLGIAQFSIGDIDYDEQTRTQFSAKKESYLNAERSKAQRQEEVQQRLMIEEKGRRQVAEVQATENQEKERQTIQAERAAAVAEITKRQRVTEASQRTEVAEQLRLEAEKLKLIAEVKAHTAELDKKASISAAEAKQKTIELGGGISEEKKLLAEIAAQRDIGVAEALSKVQVPRTVIAGGANGGNPMESLIQVWLLKGTGVIKAGDME